MANPSGFRTSVFALRKAGFVFASCLVAISLGFVPSASAARAWQTLNDCTLIPNPGNDGDSFHVRYKGKEYIFRLYFVDAPETDDEFPNRVAEQAAYFHISKAQALATGRAAARFTRRKLQDQFTVITRWQDALGQSKLERYYAFVGKNGNDLAQELVEEGLARIHGVRANKPGGLAWRAYETRLNQLEGNARLNHHGAWAYATSHEQ